MEKNGTGAQRIEAEMNAILAASAPLRRYFVWAQLVTVFVLLELALWAPTRAIRNRWALIATASLLVFILTDLITTRTSLKRLGLGLPSLRGAAVILCIGLAAAILLLTLVYLAGGRIPA